MTPVLRFKRIGSHSLPLPAYARDGDAGMDLRAATTTTWRVYQGHTVIIPCGFAVEIPPGFEGQVRPRSGLSRRGVVATLGTLDSGYRGEVGINLMLIGAAGLEFFDVHPGDRVAQLVVSPVATCTIVEADELSETERGERGWGSSWVL